MPSEPYVWIVGFPRCGTTSLCRALEILGWNLIDNPRHWDQIEGHNGGADAFVVAHWQELLAMTPQAKFILNTRDFGSWVQSLRRIPGFWRSQRFYDRYLRQRVYGTSDPEDVERLRDAWESHHVDVRRRVPAEQLLEISLPLSWEPLCKFLEVRVPDLPFPHLNNKSCADVVIRCDSNRLPSR